MATWTQEEIDALKAAIASGVLSVRYADRTVTYHSLQEMRALLAEMQRDVKQPKPYTLIATRKGV